MKVEVCTTDWAETVADAFSRWMLKTPTARVCLPTGSTPAPIYARVQPDALRQAEVLLLDEFGGLDPDDPGRCMAMLQRDLLDRVSAGSVVCPDVDTPPPEDAAKVFAAHVTRRPIQLAVLGIGINGHIGMNEPGSSTDAIVLVSKLAASTGTGALRYGARVAPTWGITIGLGALLAADEVWLLANGAAKRPILDAAINGWSTPDVPASLLQTHPNCTFWLDTDAAP